MSTEVDNHGDFGPSHRGICKYVEWKINMNGINWISADVESLSAPWWCKYCHYYSRRCLKYPHRCEKRVETIKRKLDCKCENCVTRE